MMLLVCFFCFVGNHRCGEGLLLLYGLFFLASGIFCASVVTKFVFPRYLGNFCNRTVSKNGFLLFTFISIFRMGSSVLGVDFFNLLQKTCLGLGNSHQVIIFHQLLNVVFAFVIFNVLVFVLHLR